MTNLRDAFLTYFDRTGHHVCASTPLIPQGDPTLLFTSAGMVPFKPYFLGLKKGTDRAASCQKCFRTTDIERVGTTIRHLTFFEMLGNFSFGDYFKADAVHFAWDFLTKTAGLDPKLLHPTVFKDDDEALTLWKKEGIRNPVTRLGEDTNFWAMGPTGPCGPCSEIYYDLGEDKSCGKPACAVGCDCDRYLEIWNLVFMQFERKEDGTLKPLPFKNIDTGMGLERLTMVVEGKDSPFETGLFSPIVKDARSRLRPPQGPEDELAYRVIADHTRGAVMLSAEGIIPSNVERGYVLRRLIRRAARYGWLLGAREPFLYKLAAPAIEIFKNQYPELLKAAKEISDVLHGEEKRFLETLEKGERELQDLLAKTGRGLSGEQAFKLYDTFGFPLELTQEICRLRGLSVDAEGFHAAASAASETARAGWQGSGEKWKGRYEKLASENPGFRSEFVGYHKTALTAQIALILKLDAHGESPADSDAQTLAPGDEGEIILKTTPFYPEGGGQVGDQGSLWDDIDRKKKLAEVLDTRKPHPNFIVHRVRALKTIQPHMRIWAEVDKDRRRTTAYHHTATHLLNEALRRVLGASVRQAGSLVAPDRLRFDFTHPKPLTKEELAQVSALVNEAIAQNLPVSPQERSASEIASLGAVTLLGENYGTKPRFLLIGPKGWDAPLERFSLELCGGTHVSRTGEIQNFKIIKESSVASGIRRIEAVAGPALEQLARIEEGKLREGLKESLLKYIELTSKIQSVSEKPYKDVLRKLPDPDSAPLDDVRKALGAMGELNKILKSELEGLKRQKLSQQAKLGQVVLEVAGIKLSAQKFNSAEMQTLRSISDKVKRELGTGVVLLGSTENNRLSFVVSVTSDLVEKGVDAVRIAQAVAALQKGKAGGRQDFAQGGGPDTDWEDIVNRVKELIRS